MDPKSQGLTNRLSDFLSALFVVFVLLFAAQGPIQELVKIVVPMITAEWEELSRKDQRLALKSGLIGGTFQFLKINFYSKTAVFLGIPVLFSLAIVALKFTSNSGKPQPLVRWVITIFSVFALGWYVPTAQPLHAN